jgi:hypothetical protein
MKIGSAITFDSAEREYNEAWNAPSSTRFELPPVDVNAKPRFWTILRSIYARARRRPCVTMFGGSAAPARLATDAGGRALVGRPAEQLELIREVTGRYSSGLSPSG